MSEKASAPRLLETIGPTYFAAPMGLFGSGHVLAGLAASEGAPFDSAAQIVFIISALVLVVVMGLCGARALFIKGSLRADFSHPQVMNFGAALAIAIILAARALAGYSQPLADYAQLLLFLGAILSFGFAILVVRQWLTLALAPEDMTPAWFLPVAGNLVAAKALYDFGFPFAGSVFGGIGFFGWLMVLPIVMHRLIVAPRVEPALRPSLFILIAPPGLATSAFLAFTSEPMGVLFAALSLGFGLFLLVVLATLVRQFEEAPFSAAWWSYTFPSAALASGALALAGALSAPGGPASGPPPGLMLLAHGLAGLNLTLTAGVSFACLYMWRKGKRPLPA